MPFTRTDLAAQATSRFVDVEGDRIEAVGIRCATPADPTRLVINTPSGTTHDPSASVSIAPDADGVKALVVRPNSASQTANLVEVQSVAGSPLVAIGAGGQVGMASAPNSGCQLLLLNPSSSRKAMTIVRAASQSVNIWEVLDSNQTTLMVAVTPGGAFRAAKGLSILSQSFAQNGAVIATLAVHSPTFVRLTGSGGGVVNLPNSSMLDGLVFIFRNAGTGAVTIAGAGNLIDGSASITLNPSSSVSLRFDSGISAWDTF